MPVGFAARGPLALPAAGAPATWNPLDKHSSWALSGGDLVATLSTSVYTALRSTTGVSSGRKYCEVHYTGVGNTFVFGLGIATGDTELSNATPTTLWRIEDTATGEAINQWWHGEVYDSITGNLGNNIDGSSGDRLGMAVDFDTDKIWWRKNGGNWNNAAIGSQNPAVGSQVGGYSISGLGSGPFYVIISGNQGGSGNTVHTANFGASAFTDTPPVGYESGWTA